jgi:hypothetical protein
MTLIPAVHIRSRTVNGCLLSGSMIARRNDSYVGVGHKSSDNLPSAILAQWRIAMSGFPPDQADGIDATWPQAHLVGQCDWLPVAQARSVERIAFACCRRQIGTNQKYQGNRICVD